MKRCGRRRAHMRCSSAGTAAWKACSATFTRRHSSGSASVSSAWPVNRRLPLERFNGHSRAGRTMTCMRRTGVFILTLALVAPLAAAPRKAAPKPAPKPPVEAKLIQSCDAHKFEAVVDTVVDGQPSKSKVRLCGVEGQSDADWIGTLHDAIRKLVADKEMAPGKREQIVAAIKAEIARLSIVGTPVPPKREAREQSTPPLSRDYAALPPLPTPPETPVTASSTQPMATTNVASPTKAAPLPSVQ